MSESLAVRPHYMGEETFAAIQDEPKTEETQEVQEVEEVVEELKPEEDTYKKRYGDLRRHEQKLRDTIKELEAKNKELEEETKAPKWVPPKNPEELEAFKAENPDAADFMETIAHAQFQRDTEKLTKLQEELKATTESLSIEKARSVLLMAHPDWDEIKETDEFHEWAQNQSKLIQDAIYNNPDDGASAASAISLYKQDAGITPTKSVDEKKLKKDAAALVDTKSGASPAPSKRTFTRREIEAMSMHEYEKLESEIVKAHADGRILDDKPGK